MSDQDLLADARVGVVTPLILPAEGPNAEGRVESLRDKPARPEDRVRGWVSPRILGTIPDSLETAWVEYNVIASSVTDDSMEEEDISPLADLSREDSDSRFLIVNGTDSDLQHIIGEYFECIGFKPERVGRLPIDDSILKLLYADRDLVEVVRGVKTESQQLGYKGGSKLRAHPDFDVREDRKFKGLLDDEWTRLKFIPRPEGIGFDGLPPVVELRKPGALRLWVGWSEERVLALIREICERVLALQDQEPDEEMLLDAADPFDHQSELGDFF